MIAILAATALTSIYSPWPRLVDGRCDEISYNGVTRRDLGGGVALIAAHDDDYLYLCVPLPPGSLGTMDLYIQGADGALHNLHISAQLGERVRGPEGWPEWRFGNQQGWYGPAVAFRGLATQPDGTRRMDFAPSTAREIQIGRARFGPGPWRIRIELRALGPRGETLVFPAGSSDDSAEGWAQLDFVHLARRPRR